MHITAIGVRVCVCSCVCACVCVQCAGKTIYDCKKLPQDSSGPILHKKKKEKIKESEIASRFGSQLKLQATCAAVQV